MDLNIFRENLSGDNPPQGISVYLKSLWYDGTGDWNKAHQIIQDVNDGNAAWIHAFLHRKEGDVSNAGYWYHRANKKIPTISLEKEWNEIVMALI